jgi:hypothetical protein
MFPGASKEGRYLMVKTMRDLYAELEVRRKQSVKDAAYKEAKHEGDEWAILSKKIKDRMDYCWTIPQSIHILRESGRTVIPTDHGTFLLDGEEVTVSELQDAARL